MYSVGVFYAWDWFVLIVITIAYLICPKRFIEEKKEYVKFLLLFLSGYFFLFLIVTNLIKNSGFVHHLFGICLPLILLIGHCLYPFKKTKRNQHVSFFLFWIAIYTFGLRGIIMILHALLGNNM
jgi:hypothetical protein